MWNYVRKVSVADEQGKRACKKYHNISVWKNMYTEYKLFDATVLYGGFGHKRLWYL